MVTKKTTRFYGCQIATTNSVKQHKLRKLIAWLSDKEGKGMEFISLYIPREKSIGDIIAILTLVTKVVNNQTILLKNEEIE